MVNEMLNQEDTIAAIATALSPAGISIIRISGDQAVEIADRIFEFAGASNQDKHLTDVESHTIHYGYICENGERIDEVMVLVMRAPRSYTREDTVEIDCHGGVYVTKQILKAVLSAGARAAEPGEFTKRAFLNGRIDLSRAEAVIDVINSQNQFALRSSMQQLRGGVYEEISEIRDMILDDISFIESGLDDPEHISLDGFSKDCESHVESCLGRLVKIKEHSEQGRLMKDGVETVIIGKPNTGKSSLMNYLSGTDLAIVTDIEGTTRDTIREQIRIGDLILNLTDTAGIRTTDNVVEKIGVEKAKKVAADADLVLFVIDTSSALTESDEEIFSIISEKNTVIILNKMDLDPVITENYIREHFSINNIPVVQMSAKQQNGLEALEQTLMEMFAKGVVDYNHELYITNLRQLSAIEEAIKSLVLVRDSIEMGMSEDFLSIDLMNAYTQLGLVIGEAVEEDLVNRIFEKFCMGK